MNRTITTLSLCIGVCLVGLSPSGVDAFECTRSTKHEFVSLRWDTNDKIPYAIQTNRFQRTDPEHLKSALAAGFGAWSDPTCSNLQFEFKGEVAQSTPLTDINQIIIVSEDWPEGTIDAVGLTTMTYNSLNGVIKFGKIEINEANFEFVDVLETGCDFNAQYDLHAVFTHEVGHFIGLAHLSEEDAEARILLGEDPPTMSRAVFECDEQFRTLEADDLEGACFVYPAGQRSRSCATLPLQSSSFVTNDVFGCATTPAREGRGRTWGAIFNLGVLGWGFTVFRRRQRR